MLLMSSYYAPLAHTLSTHAPTTASFVMVKSFETESMKNYWSFSVEYAKTL